MNYVIQSVIIKKEVKKPERIKILNSMGLKHNDEDKKQDTFRYR